MSPLRAISYASVVILATNLASIVRAQVPAKRLPTPQVPSKSLPASVPVVRSFDASGIKKVLLRAGFAEVAEVKTVPGGRSITVSGMPEGGAVGYHSPDPNWRETPASKWGLDFQARSFGPTLVISTEKEMQYIHHHYALGSLTITVPEGVEVIKENLKLSGVGPPDLSPPAGR